MQLIVGLGNPGAQYAGNRHNIGWMAIDRIAADHGFSPWRARFQGLVAEGRLGDEKVVALKPQTFMNLSGKSVTAALQFWKFEPEQALLAHDELDLPPGEMKFKKGGGDTGTLVVKKIVTSTVFGAQIAGWAYPIAVTCAGTTANISLPDGGSQTYGSLLTGTQCHV